MKDGIGEGMTREDHKDVASQLFAAYSRVKTVRNLASIIGEEELSPADKMYLRFGDRFETDFLSQGEFEDRSIERTLELGWRLLATLPKEDLLRGKKDYIKKYLPETLEEAS
jgi:V/A-type H+-transporting ATPase subunit B